MTTTKTTIGGTQLLCRRRRLQRQQTTNETNDRPFFWGRKGTEQCERIRYFDGRDQRSYWGERTGCEERLFTKERVWRGWVGAGAMVAFLTAILSVRNALDNIHTSVKSFQDMLKVLLRFHNGCSLRCVLMTVNTSCVRRHRPLLLRRH